MGRIFTSVGLWLRGLEGEAVHGGDTCTKFLYRYLSRNDNGICIYASNDTKWRQKKKNQLTESEIKQDFEWEWQFAKEVE